MSNLGTFIEWAPIYRALGLEPRPVTPSSKACRVKSWTKSDAELGPDIIKSWDEKHAQCGIGLRMGTPLPGGGFLGAIDIDDDDYVRPVQALLNNPISGRFGSKGAVFFVRVLGDLKNSKFKVKGEAGKAHGQVVECLFKNMFCVIPPTIHPTTGNAYRWLGTPLHEVDFNQLPIIGE